MKDGLPNGSVTALAQTSDGFLWIGTSKGLARFDGLTFSRAGSDSSDGLLDARVKYLLAGSQNALWIISKSGIVTRYAAGRYERKFMPDGISDETLNELEKSALVHDEPWQVWNEIRVLARDAVDRVWAITDPATLVCFDTNGQFIPTITNGLPAGPLRAICPDAEGNIWVIKGTNGCQLQGQNWIAFPLPPEQMNDSVLTCPGQSTGLWLASTSSENRRKKIVRQTAKGWGEIFEPELQNQLSAVLEDRHGTLWFSDWWDGLRFRSANNSIHPIEPSGALAKSVITCLLEDRQGAIWAGTIGEGLHQIKSRSIQTILLPVELSSFPVTSVCATSDDSLWVGTRGGGLCRTEQDLITRFGFAEGLTSDQVDLVAQDPHGRIWASCGLDTVIFESGRFRIVTNLGPTLAFAIDAAGHFWVAGPGKLTRFSDPTNSVSYYAQDGRYLDIRAIACDKNGGVWLAVFGGGIWRLHNETLVDVNAEIKMPRNDARSLFCDEQGVLWIGTLNGGLFRWNHRELKGYSMLDGFPDDSIIGLAGDGYGNLWMASGNGIFGCSVRSLNEYERSRDTSVGCWLLGMEEGLANRGCSGGGQSVITRQENGTFWVANMVGAAGFDPRLITLEQASTNVFLEAVVVDGVKQNSNLPEHRVRTDARRFEFHYTTPDLQNSKLLHFRYRLKGLDDVWMDAGTERVAVYSKLPPGNYQFQVMVSGGNGSWHGSDLSAVLRVIPFFWERRWVQGLFLALVVSSAAALLIVNQRRKLQIRLERITLQHTLEKERSRIARDIHDHLGASLTQISLMSELPEQLPVKADHLVIQLDRISTKSRSAVQALNEIVWAINPGNDNLPKLMDYVWSMSEELCDAAKIRCWHEIPPSLPSLPVEVSFRHSLILAIREAINNAIKHSGANSLWVRAALEGTLLRIEVEDNGRGFNLSTVDTGRNGLKNLSVRLAQLNGTTQVISSPDHGTKVTFSAPITTKT